MCTGIYLFACTSHQTIWYVSNVPKLQRITCTLLMLQPDTARVVFSWNDADPTAPDGSDAMYHQTRGSASINLLGGLRNPQPDSSNTSSFTFRVNNVRRNCASVVLTTYSLVLHVHLLPLVTRLWTVAQHTSAMRFLVEQSAKCPPRALTGSMNLPLRNPPLLGSSGGYMLKTDQTFQTKLTV